VHVVPAGHDASYLAPAPLALVPMDEELRSALHALGLRTVGALAALSAEDVERRWGEVGIRAWRLARADYVHALGSLATLAIVVFLTQAVLAFILRGAGGAAIDVAFILANVLISPLLFIGAALLYVDQAARFAVE